MWGTKTRSSSKRSRKGTNTARRWGPHDSSSSQCSRGGSGGQARNGPGVSCPCPLAVRATSPEQLSCSHSRERKPSKRQATKRWKTEHFRGRPLGINLDLPSSQGSCAAFLREGNIVGGGGGTWVQSSQAGPARPPWPTRRLRLPPRLSPSAPPLGPLVPLLRLRRLLPEAVVSKVPRPKEDVNAQPPELLTSFRGPL